MEQSAVKREKKYPAFQLTRVQSEFDEAYSRKKLENYKNVFSV